MKTLTDLSNKAGFALLTLFGFFLPMVFCTQLPDQFIAPKQYFVNTFSLLLLVILAVKLLSNGMKIQTTPITVPLALWCGWCTLTVLWSVNKICSLRELSDVFLTVLFIFYVREFVPSLRGIKVLLWAMVLSGVLITCLNLLEWKWWYYRFDLKTWELVYATDEFLSRQPNGQFQIGTLKQGNLYIPLFPLAIATGKNLGATTGNKNNLGSVQAFLIFCTLSLFLPANHWLSGFFSGMALLILLIGSAALGSAAALIGAGIGGGVFLGAALIMLFLSERLDRYRFRIFGLFWIGTVGLVLTMTSPQFSVISRFKNLTDHNSSFVSRITDYRVTLKAIGSNLHRLLYGYGFSGFKHIYPTLAAKHIPDHLKDSLPDGISRHAHSDWIQGLAEIGFFGLVLTLFLLWFLLAEMLKWAISHLDPTRSAFRALFSGLHFLAWGAFASLFSRKPSQTNGLQTATPEKTALSFSLSVGLLGALAAILGNALGDFPLNRICPRVYLALTMGLLIWLTSSASSNSDGEPAEGRAVPKSILLLFPLLVLIGAVLGWRSTYFRFQADKSVWIADAIIAQGNKEQFPLAARYLYQGLLYDPLPGYAWLKFSTIMERLGNIPAAVFLAEKSLPNINLKEYSMSNHSVMLQLAHLSYDKLKAPQKTMPFAAQGLFLTCGYDRLIFYHYLCNSMLDLGQTREAEGLLQRWFTSPHVLLTPHLPETVEKLGYYYGAMEKWEPVLPIVDKALGLFPTNYRLLRLKGNALGNLGKIEEGVLWLKKAQEANPNSFVVTRDLGVLLLRSPTPQRGAQIIQTLSERVDLTEEQRKQAQQILSSHH